MHAFSHFQFTNDQFFPPCLYGYLSITFPFVAIRNSVFIELSILASDIEQVENDILMQFCRWWIGCSASSPLFFNFYIRVINKYYSCFTNILILHKFVLYLNAFSSYIISIKNSISRKNSRKNYTYSNIQNNMKRCTPPRLFA